MHKLRPTLLVALVVTGSALGWLGQMALAATSAPLFTPPATLVLVLVGIAVLVVAVGWPIRQLTRGRLVRRVDPFRAMRVLLLAKAAALTGALLGGASAGALVFLLTRPVPAGGSSAWLTVASLVGAGASLIAGLLVEHWCRLPPEDRGQPTSAELQHR